MLISEKEACERLSAPPDAERAANCGLVRRVATVAMLWNAMTSEWEWKEPCGISTYYLSKPKPVENKRRERMGA